MRLFVAVVPPAEVVEELAAAVAPLRSAAPRLRWSEPDRWHVTLAFLGQVPDAVRPGLADRLDRVTRRHGPVDLTLAGGGRFGDRVLWVGVSGDLAPLAAGVRRAVERAGVTTMDNKPLRAHLTLARVPNGRRVDLRPLVDSLRQAVPARSWVMSGISLMSSVGGPSPVYRTEMQWVLRGERPRRRGRDDHTGDADAGEAGAGGGGAGGDVAAP